MRRGGRILILLGIILGVIAAGGTFFLLSSQPAPTQQIQTRSIVIALQNIPGRAEIQVSALGKADYPISVIPPGAFDRIEDVSGKLAIEPIFQGQIILPQMIVDKSKVNATSRSNASFLIPEGKVAIAFPINTLSGVAGALQSGDTVDLLLTLNPNQIQSPAGRTTTAATTIPGTEGLPATQLMLQDVLILQIGPWIPVSGNQPQNTAPADTITFVLERQDALALKSAREQGTIELALRRAGDHKLATTEPVNLQYLNRRFNFNLAPLR